MQNILQCSRQKPDRQGGLVNSSEKEKGEGMKRDETETVLDRLALPDGQASDVT